VQSDPPDGMLDSQPPPVPGSGEKVEQVAGKEVSGSSAMTGPTLQVEVSEKSSTNIQSGDPKPAAEDDKIDYGRSVYCQDCRMMLNGPEQWRDHRNGKKHRKLARARSDCGPQEKVTKDKMSASKKADFQGGGRQLNKAHSPRVEGQGVKEQGSLRERSADFDILDGVGSRFLEQHQGEGGEPQPYAGQVAASTEVPAAAEACYRGNTPDDDSIEHESMSQVSQAAHAVAAGYQQQCWLAGEQGMHMTGPQWGGETWSSRSRMHTHPQGYNSVNPCRGVDPYWSYQRWHPDEGRTSMGMRRMTRMARLSGKNQHFSVSKGSGAGSGNGGWSQRDEGVWSLHPRSYWMPMGQNMASGLQSHLTTGMRGPMPWQMCPSGVPPCWNRHHNLGLHADEGGPHTYEGWESQGLPSVESAEHEPAEEVTSTEVQTQ